MINIDDFIIDKLELTPSINLLNEIIGSNIEKYICTTDCTFVFKDLTNCDLLRINTIADIFGYDFKNIEFDKRSKKYFAYFSKPPIKFVVNDLLKLFTDKLYFNRINIRDSVANIEGDEIELFTNKDNNDMLELNLDIIETGFGAEHPLIYYNTETMKLTTRDKITVL